MFNMIWSWRELKSVELGGNVLFKLIKSFVSTFKVRKFGAKIPGTRDTFREIRPEINSTCTILSVQEVLSHFNSNLMHKMGQDFLDR